MTLYVGDNHTSTYRRAENAERIFSQTVDALAVSPNVEFVFEKEIYWNIRQWI